MPSFVRVTALYAALGLGGLAALAGIPAAAQAPAAPAAAAAAARPPAPVTSHDPKAAAAGVYKLDAEHSSMVVRILHMNGVGFMTFRMPELSGTLNWDPAKIENSKVDATVSMASVFTPVKGFGEEIAGKGFLESDKWPTARFVSTSIKRTGPTKGMITGDLNFMGQTHPMTLDTEMNGTLKNARGVTIIGLTANGVMDRSKWGFTGQPGDSYDVHFLMDIEFDNPGPAA